VQQCNDSGVQVVALLSSGGGGDIEQLTVRHDLALCGVEAEGRENLDSLAGCGIIGCEHLFVSEIIQLALGDLILFTGPFTPVSPRWESKTGAGIEVHAQRPFVLKGYSVVLLVQSAS
jgi:hypothetical protein